MRLFPAVLILAALCGCRRDDVRPVAAASTPAVPVRLLALTEQEFVLTVPVTGTLVSRTRVEVKAETVGRVLRFPKEEGDSVQAGEAVIWVDDANHRLSMRQAESGVAVAEAALERAKVAESHAASELERARNLVSSGGITDKDLKAAVVADKDSRAQVGLAAAQLEQARAALAVARKHLGDTVIHAPVAGEIQKKYVNPGAYVEAPTPVFVLVDNNRLELETSVPSSELGSVRPGQRVTFSVNSHPGVKFEGRVIEISPSVDADSRAAKVRIQASGGARKLREGMFAEGEILTGAQSKAIVIPSSAIYRDDRSAKDSYVFVAASGKAVRRAVRIGRERDSTVEVTAGLSAGEQLIAEQSIELGDGVPVKGAR